MIKKIAGLALAMTLISSTPVFASMSSDANSKAAPALAVEILEDHGVEPSGDILKLVAQNVGPNASFMGTQKSDPMYKHKVMHYLHHTLNVIEMDQDVCEHLGMME